MTVILAGLYGNGDGAIVVSDKMRTVKHPLTNDEFETENEAINKTKKLNDSVYIACSGSDDFWGEILDKVEEQIHPTDKPRKVRAIIEKEYRKQHMRWLEATVLVPLGFENLKDYNARANIELPPARIEQIDRQLRETLGTGELVLIAQENDRYMLYGLQDPGLFKQLMSGFAVCGSGAKSALQTVVTNYEMGMHKKQLEELLLKAKKLSEQDKGVGKLTNILYIPEV
ncbi:hypothetical protein HYS84_02695 [Candidatus Saccharibacteria bacterium]|nr:hypothetical protein [Candidatus Saccharibacteria bacterium]